MPPTNARSFLVVDDTEFPVDDKRTPEGDAFVQRYFNGLNTLHNGKISGFRVAFVNLQNIWQGVLTSPGFEAFGYTSSGSCVTGDSTIGSCSDPAHTFYWLPRCVRLMISAHYLPTDTGNIPQASLEANSQDYGRLHRGSFVAVQNLRYRHCSFLTRGYLFIMAHSCQSPEI